MAPPVKRRRLSRWSSSEEIMDQLDAVPSFSHLVVQLDLEPSPSPSPSLPAVEEVHIELRDHVFLPADAARLQLYRRQGIAASSDTAATAPIGTAASSTTSTTSLPAPAASSSTTASPDLGVSSSPLVSSGSTSSAGANGSTPDITASSALSSASLVTTGIITSETVPSSTRSISSIANSSSVVSSLPLPTLTASTLSGIFPSSATKNLTAAESILLSNSSTGLAFLSAGLQSTSLVTNSTLAAIPTTSTSTSTSTSTHRSSSSSTDNEAQQYSTLYLTSTMSQNGHAVSTITNAVGVVGAGSSTTSASSSTSSAAGASGSGSTSPPTPPGTIAGGVVGGAAGLAVVLLIAMLFLRWYKRRSQIRHQALPFGSGDGPSEMQQGPSPRDGSGLTTENTGLMPLAAALPALFRHGNRGRPDESLGPSSGAERSFQRVSGRKLASAFSPGMSSEPRPPAPIGGQGQTPGPTSFYHDSSSGDAAQGAPLAPLNPFADRPGSTSPDAPPEIRRNSSGEQMTVLPGPQRRPTMRSPDVHGPASPARVSSTAATFFQDETAGGRFTEEV